MIPKNIANLYARDSGVALNIAERDIVLTYALKRLEEKRWFDRIVFKGGTCLRKFYAGKLMRFSMDLDFTYLEKEQIPKIACSLFTKTCSHCNCCTQYRHAEKAKFKDFNGGTWILEETSSLSI